MLKELRFISIFLLILFSVSGVFSNDCYFNQDSNSCKRISSSFVNFNMDFNPISNLNNFSATIYNKDIPSNKIRVRITGNTISNINPFINPGVYVLEVKAIKKSGEIIDYKKEFIFDNSNPFAPHIGMDLKSSIISGKTNYPNEKVFAHIIGGDLKEVISDEDKNFNLNLNLNSDFGIKLVDFYTERAGLKSNKIGRIIYENGIPKENKSINVSLVNLVNLSDINENTIKEDIQNGVVYSTFKRDFYIYGTTNGVQDGGVLFINGIKTIIKSNKFATIILLNQGLNNIEIKNVNGELLKSINVTYLNSNFQFLTLNTKKIFSEDLIKINGTTNLDLPFNLYLNGKFISKITPINGIYNYDLNLNDLNNEIKYYIYLEGFNNQRISKIVYRDKENPSAVMVSNKELSKNMDLVFKIKDDIGIDTNSISLNLNNHIYSGDDFEIKGDYYIFPLNLTEGNYNYVLSFSDLYGNSGNLEGFINISNNFTLIERFDLGNFGDRIGNILYINSNNLELILKPTKNIAFNSIYLDGKRQTNYRISQNGEVNLKLNHLNKNGSLEFEFINKNHKKFKEVYTYYSDLEKPVLKLDYIQNPNANHFNFVKISGEILDSNFDWSTLKFNNQNSFIRFGKYFEANIELNDGVSNLDVSGNDLSLNSLDGFFGSVLFGDNTKTKINLENINNFEIKGNLEDYDGSRNKNYINSYLGMEVYKSFLNENNFNLPLFEYQGLISTNLLGFEDSGNKFNYINNIIIDHKKPVVYFVKKDLVNEIIIDGTSSEIKNLLVLKSGTNVDYSICSDKISLFSKCIVSSEFNSGSISISGMDEAGNSFEKVLTLNDLINFSEIDPNKYTNLPDFYFSGNNIETIFNTSVISGNIDSGSLIKSVKVNGGLCDFDDSTFTCNVNLEDGLNSFIISVENANGIVSKKFNITKLVFNSNILFKKIDGNAVYKVGDLYYISRMNLTGFASNQPKSLVKLLINNNEYLTLGEQEGNFSFFIDLNDEINNKEHDEFDIQLKTEDEYGQSVYSNKIKIIYNRVIKTLVSLFVY